jgi:hypothetical protein
MFMSWSEMMRARKCGCSSCVRRLDDEEALKQALEE